MGNLSKTDEPARRIVGRQAHASEFDYYLDSTGEVVDDELNVVGRPHPSGSRAEYRLSEDVFEMRDRRTVE